MIYLEEKVSEATEEGKMLKLRLHCARVIVDKKYNSQVAFSLVQLPIFRHNFVFFDVTSGIDIGCARSFLCQTC